MEECMRLQEALLEKEAKKRKKTEKELFYLPKKSKKSKKICKCPKNKKSTCGGIRPKKKY